LTQSFKDKSEDESQRNIKNFYRAIVTYPTVAIPNVRREIENLVRQLGFTDVNISYDEAIAAAIFYLWREFSGNKNIGLEAFKTRCRRSGDKWVQNVMVLDVGGGTTDIALIRLILKEIDPFEVGEDRGSGGRYYLLIPELMGSSGHLQLGGELITLKLFLLLKVAIVDYLLTAVTENKLTNSQLERVLNSLDPRFRSEGKYRSQSLLEYVNESENNTDSYRLALGYAEDVIHTRWSENPEYLQAFYTLWEWADKAKIQLGKGSQEYELSWDNLTELLTQNDIDLDSENLKTSIKIDKKQFEKVASSVVDEAVGIAKGLLESRLPVNESNNQKQHKEPLDWLILSGQTCNLDLVKHTIKQEFNSSKEFSWNSARITFVPEYAKLATSIGACYAFKLQQYSYDPIGAKSKLKNGDSELFIQVKNLLYTLPCFFKRVNQGVPETIFKPSKRLYILDETAVAKARSEWFPVQATISVLRQDFEKMTEVLWAEFNFQSLAQEINVYEETLAFLPLFKVQFEVNQKLEISFLLCRGYPYHLITSDHPILSVTKKNSDEVEKKEIQDKEVPQETIKNDKLQYEIWVGITEKSPHLVFNLGDVLNQKFIEDDEEQHRSFLISREPLPAFPNDGKQRFFAINPKTGIEIFIGELSSPKNQIKDNYPYYVSIDDQGCLRIHEGEVPYWRSKEKEVLMNKAGCVFQVDYDLYSQTKQNNEIRNPFSGKH
jgi:hypothetical protein